MVDALKIGTSDLNESVLEERRAPSGYNEMIGQKKGRVLKAIFKQIHQLLIYILLFSAMLTAILEFGFGSREKSPKISTS